MACAQGAQAVAAPSESAFRYDEQVSGPHKYRFDPQNWLIDIRTGATQAEATAATPSVSYSYDAQGNRVRKGGASGYLIDSSGALPEVALETRGGAAISYVRAGALLLRQTKMGAASSEDLLPLRGHLDTSLGAINIDGNLVEQVDSDAFGNLDQATGLKQMHLYTGQYWDQDAQLLYLRARWYDPKIGRFVSADPFEGKPKDPRTLNRFAYAHGNPVQASDPTGEMTLGEVGSAMDTVFTLATRAYNVYDTLNSFLGASDKLDGPPGLMDVLMTTVIKASAGGVSTSDLGDAASAASAALLLATGGAGPGHHTIPIYMCGGRNQERVTLTRTEHELLHAELLGLSELINVAGRVYQVLGKRRPPGALQPPLIQVARTPYGREAIAAGLGLFYQTEGVGGVTWANKGRGELTGRKLYLVFLKETWSFAVANHTWPTCKR